MGLRERLAATLIETSAMASETQASGTARVEGLAFNIGTTNGNINLINITATNVQSTSTATVSPLDTTGTTTISNLQLTGSLFGPSGTVTLSAELQAQLAAGTVAPNTVIFDANGVKVILNRQVETSTTVNGKTTLALTTDAIAVQFLNAPVGTGFKTGEIVVASSSASATAVQPISP